MKVFYAEDLVSFACRVADEAPTIYLFGGLGDFVTPELIEEKAAMYPEWYTAEKRAALYRHADAGVRGFDCSGLIKCWLMGGLEEYHYDSAIDWNTWRMFDEASETGPLDTLPEEPGVLLNMEGHVGVYLGGGRVIEATSAFRPDGGVQRTTIDMQKWTGWYRHCLIRYGDEP